MAGKCFYIENAVMTKIGSHLRRNGILAILADQLGTLQGIVYMIDTEVSQQDSVESLLEQYGLGP